MRLCRFNGNKLGLVQADRVLDVTSVLDRLPAQRYPLPTVDLLIAHLDELRPAIEAAAHDASSFALKDIRLDSPVANPGKVVAAPVNYKKHLDEPVPIPASITRTRSPKSRRSGCSSRRPARSSARAARRDAASGAPHRPRDRACSGDRQDRRPRDARDCAEPHRGLLHRPRHDDPRTRRSAVSESRSTASPCSGPGW